MRKLLAFTLALLASAALAQAPIQAVPTRLDAGASVAVANGAVNSLATATVNVPGGQFAYITGLSFDVSQNNSGSAAVNNVQFTSANIQGSPVWSTSLAATANLATHWQESLATPLKSAAPGTNVTITSPSPSITAAYTIRVYYYTAP